MTIPRSPAPRACCFFYALRDRVGPDAFEKALQHMLYARRDRGFDVTDLISALEQESHQDDRTLCPPVDQAPRHSRRFSYNVFATRRSAGNSRNQEATR